MFSHSRMSAGKEFQVDGAATEKSRRASSVCMQGTTSIGRAQSPRWCTGLYQRDATDRSVCQSRHAQSMPISTQSTCCRVNMQARITSARYWSNDIGCCSGKTVMWCIRLQPVSTSSPLNRLPSGADCNSKTGQTGQTVQLLV